MQKPRHWVTALLFLVILAVVLIYGYSSYRANATRETYRKNLLAASTERRSGNFTTSIEKLHKALQQPPNSEVAARVKNHLAYDLVFRNSGDDRREAVKLFKEVADDPAAPANWRAHVLNGVASIYTSTQDRSFAQNVIFSPENFGSLSENGDISLGIRRIHEKSFGVYPTAMAAFPIGQWYGAQLLTNRNLTDTQKATYLEELEKWTSRGIGLVEAAERGGYEKAALASIYSNWAANAYLLEKLGRQTQDPEAIYKKALQIVSAEKTFYADEKTLTINFHFARFLADKYGTARLQEISDLLKAIYQHEGQSFRFYEMLRNETQPGHESHIHHRHIMLLRDLVPEFRDFLAKQGLQYVE